MNLPNYITLGRIVVVPLIVVALLTPIGDRWFGISGYALAIILFLAAALTDIVDGKLARSRGQVSTLGKFLDPIADKLLVSAALIVLVEKHLAPSWAVVIIIGREFIVTGLRSIAASEGIIIQAETIGKIKMWAQCVAIVALLVFITGLVFVAAVMRFYGHPLVWSIDLAQLLFIWLCFLGASRAMREHSTLSS